jgi:hypothetical protein
LSKEACVKVNPLLTDNPSDALMIEGGVARVPALCVVFAPALATTFPVPITEGISRKLNGIFLEERTIFNRIFSLL